jgi:hypothetical protein
MRFSIRLLLAVILLIAVLIQLTQAIIDREELILLESMVARERNENKKQRGRTESWEEEWRMCETILEESSLSSLEVYLAAKKRFERLQSSTVSY